jgi:hypothetical protein
MKFAADTFLAAVLLTASAAFSQEPRPPLPPGEFNHPDRPPATPPHAEHRDYNRERPRDLRNDRDSRPDRFGPNQPRFSDRRFHGPGRRDAAPGADRPNARPPGEFSDRPRHEVRPEDRRDRLPSYRPHERRRPDFRDAERPRRDFQREGRPMRPRQNFRNPDRRPEFRDLAPMVRGPRPEMERPRERDDQWDHRAPRFPRREAGRRDDRRDERRSWEPQQPLPFQ